MGCAVISDNVLSDLPAFLAAWHDASHPRNQYAVVLRRTPTGRIGEVRHHDPGSGLALTRHHPDFRKSVEPHVRPVVERLVECWGQITYSSCDGHEGPNDSVYQCCYVGLVALNAEHAFRVERLVHVLLATGADRIVRPRARKRELTGGGVSMTAVDWVLAPLSSAVVPWSAYAPARDEICRDTAARLDALHRSITR